MENTIVQGNNLNDLETTGKTATSKFVLSAPFANTERYGEYSIIKALEVVPKDKIRIQLPHDLRSYTLKAPMMQNLQMHQDLFFTPIEAIIPNSAEKVVVNPIKGDDVPEDANTVVYGFKTKIRTIVNAENADIVNNMGTLINADGSDNGFTKKFLKWLLLAEMFYSPGGLLANMEYTMNSLFNNQNAAGERRNDFGMLFDKYLTLLYNATGTSGYWLLSNGNDDYRVVKTNPMANQIDLRTALCIMRDGYSWDLTVVGAAQDFSTFTTKNSSNKYIWENGIGYSIASTVDADEPFNYARLVAYQIICAHYYSNDKIDYIYTADLWRQNLKSYLLSLMANKTYSYNGITVEYDSTAGEYMDEILTGNYTTEERLEYLRMIFGFNRSLRYQDYFTGGRSNPLAVGDVNVNVQNAQVSVVDITKNIQKQRFLNAVNRVGSKIGSYIKELFGIEPAPDFHNPFWQGHTTDYVSSPETENTGAAQYDFSNTPMAVTSNFRSNAGTNEFEIHVDRFGIVLAIRYYDIPRLYYRGADRHFFHANRFDMFNPFMQFQGDQPVYEGELLSKTTNGLSSYFGYQGRNMEYKQPVSRAAGGFIYNLPSYVFLADYTRNMGANGDEVISPNYIRSIQTELDRFYGSINGYSLDSYFHFIVINKTQIEANRPMAYNPEILG